MTEVGGIYVDSCGLVLRHVSTYLNGDYAFEDVDCPSEVYRVTQKSLNENYKLLK